MKTGKTMLHRSLTIMALVSLGYFAESARADDPVHVRILQIDTTEFPLVWGDVVVSSCAGLPVSGLTEGNFTLSERRKQSRRRFHK